MNSRFFAFGCSYTKWIWPTWADFIGINFSEYYNCGRGGASNSYIMQKLIEVDHQYKFNPETDFVTIMITGVNRFSFYHESEWRTFGDMSGYSILNKPPVAGRKLIDKPYFHELKSFVTDLWNPDWAVYNTWISVIAIKNFLVAKNIPHKLLLALETDHWVEKPGLVGITDIISNKKIAEVIQILDNRVPLSTLTRRDATKFQDGTCDGHPTMSMHYDYVKKNFPEFVTETSDSFFQSMNEQFNPSSPDAQSKAFELSLVEYKNIQRI